MQLLFLGVWLAGVAVLFLRRRRFDFFSVGFACATVYYLPAFIGRTTDIASLGALAVESRPLEGQTFAILATLFAGVTLAAFLYDAAHGPGRARGLELSGALSTAAVWATLLGCFGLAATLYSVGGRLFDPQKADVLEAIDRWYQVWTMGALVGTVLGVVSRRWLWAAASALLLLFDVYAGFRTSAALASIGLFAWFLARGDERRILSPSSWRITSAALLVGAGFFLYKGFYIAIKSGAWDLVQERALDLDYIAEVVVYSSEPFLVTGTLNEVVRSGFAIDASHYVGVVYLLVPFAPELGARTENFNELFQPSLFPEHLGGLASNFLAEAWACGGWAALLLVVGLYASGLWIGSRLLACRSRWTQAFAAAFFPCWAFYIHRNDLLYQAILQRRILLCFLAATVASAVVARALRLRPRAVVARRPVTTRGRAELEGSQP